jgi:hypothetical protein
LSQAVHDRGHEPHAHYHPHDHDDGQEHEHGHGGHGHSHGLVDRSIIRARAGLKAVALSLALLAAAALAQVAIFVFTGSVALLADLTHNAAVSASPARGRSRQGRLWRRMEDYAARRPSRRSCCAGSTFCSSSRTVLAACGSRAVRGIRPASG